MFKVQISRTADVCDLKNAIKHVNHNVLANVDSRDLALHKVSVSKEGRKEFLNNLKLDLQTQIDGQDQLSDVFADPPLDGHLHIIVTLNIRPLTGGKCEYIVYLSCSDASVALSRERFPPSDYRLVSAKRSRYLNANEPKAPSSAGKAPEFAKLQNDPEKTILCSRPASAEATIPVTMLHPVFGEFLDNCERHETTVEDNRFTRELSTAMSGFYTDENDRKKTIHAVFAKHGLHFMKSRVGPNNYETDGDISMNGYRYTIAEFKNEVGCIGAEPYSQAALYYLESTRTQAPELPESVLPCIIVLIFGQYVSRCGITSRELGLSGSGTYIVFAGAAWTERPTLQVLSTPLALHYHRTDTENRIRVARHVGALKRAIHSLEEHYRVLTPTHASSSSSSRIQLYPYRNHFTPHADQSSQAFEYISQPFVDKLLFFGTLPDNEKICVKFVRRYSVEAHNICASMGCAPTLRSFERIEGGWFMWSWTHYLNTTFRCLAQTCACLLRSSQR